MKSMLMILFAAIGVAAAIAQTNPSEYNHPTTPAVPVAPQVYGGGYGGGYGYGSPGTAAGSSLQGMASVVNARGNYNLSTSAAAMNMTQAQKQEIQNWSSFSNTYFDLRAANRRARAAESTPNLTEAQLNRIAQEGAPKPLATQQMDPVSGKIFWPDVLQDDKFQEQRETLQAAFEERANLGTMPWKDVQRVKEVTQTMLDELSDMVRDLAPADYLPAKRFIQSLAYEARKPLS